MKFSREVTDKAHAKYFFESYEDADGNRVYKAQDGSIKAAKKGFYNPKDGSIHIDLNGDNILFTVAHELVHFIRDWSPKQFQKMADIVMEGFNRQGLTVEELIAHKQAEYAEDGIELTEDEAFEEVIAAALEGIVADGRVMELLQRIEAEDKGLGTKIKKFFQDIGRMIRDTIDSYKSAVPDSAEGRLIRKLEDIYSQLQEVFAEGVMDAGENFRLAREDIENDGDLRYSKYAKVFFKENVFPPYNESHSEAHELAERWSRSDSAKVRDKRLISFHNKWYLIQAFDDLKYGYQIIKKLTAAEYKKESKFYDTITGYESIQDSLSKDATQHSGRGADRRAGYRSDYDASEHGGENSEVYGLGSDKIRRSDSARDSGRDRGRGTTDSRRDNRSSITADSDIRYSAGRKTDKTALEMVEKENAKLREDLAQLKELLKLQGKETHGTKFTPSSVEAAARYLKKNAGAKGDTNALTKLLNGFYEYIATEKDLAWESVREKAKPIANWLMDHVEHGRSDYAQEVLDHIHDSRIYLDESQKAEAAYLYGSFHTYRKSLMGYVTIAKDANMSLDTWWQEMVALYPDVFDSGISASNMPSELADVINNLRNENSSALEYEHNRRLIEQDLIREVYDSYWRVNSLRTVAGRNAAQVNRLKSKHYQRINDLKTDNRQKTEQMKLQHRAAVKAVRDAYRQRIESEIKDISDKYRESRKKAVEGRNKTVLRQKIRNFKKKLEGRLLRPTDRQYVPIDLIRAMVDVCNIIDTDTDLYKDDGSINKAQAKRDETKEKLQNLKDEYERLKTHSDPIYAGEFDEMVYAYLAELRDNFSGKSLQEMSVDELAEMYEILRAIDETLADARKLIGWGDAENVYEAGDAIVAEQNAITQKRKDGKRNAAQKGFDKVDNLGLSPVRNVERMSGYNQDSALLKLFRKFEQGIRKKNKFKMDAYKSFEQLTSGKEYDDAIYNEVGGKKYTDVKGRKFGISKMQMMQAILSWEREMANKNLHHIEKGGFTFADIDKLRKGDLKEAVSAEYSHRVPAATEMVSEFKEILKDDKWCQDYMAAARGFFNGMAKDAINETSIALKHRIIAKDKNYIPFEVDTNFVNTEITDMDAVQKTINSYGMLKDTKDNAPQALYITGLNNILDRHIEQVGNVYGLAIEVRNFNKVWNVRSKDESGNDPNVKESIDTNWGKDGVKHIEQAVKDIQGPRVRERNALYDKVKSGYIGATFLLNLSVVTKQNGSLFSATSMLRWRSPFRMLGNLYWTMVRHKKIAAEVDKYTASAWMRRQGMSDAELYTLMSQARKPGVFRWMSKAPAIINPTKWITARDHAVALSLWKYAKQDTAKRTGLKGEELLKATAEFYDEVIENTQSMTDVLHRPEIQKRGDVISESFSMFKTDLYQMAGQLQSAAGRFTANKTKENGKVLARTVYSVAMSALWGQLMTTVFALLRYKVDPYRDDEDDELTAESWLKRQGVGFAGDIMGYIFPIFGSEVVGVFENIMYGESDDAVDNIVLTAINDLYNAMITIGTSIKDGEWPEVTDMRKLAAKALQLFGIPANNILRALDAIRLHAEDIANGEFLSFEAGVDRTAAKHIHRIMEAAEAGNDDVAAGLYEEAIEELAIRKSKDGSWGEDELKEAKSDLRTSLGKKYRDGEISKDTTNMILSELFGDSPEEVDGKIAYWDFVIDDPDSDVPSQWFITYYEKVESFGIDLDTYVKYRTLKKNLTKKEEISEAIHSMDLSKEQKDALYLAEEYAESTLDETPWH